ncbi:MAG: hypothetical protein VYC55_07925 [Pseudomonadota bacterium]|nr:hypothetical protein [Pseudomonadota bacterium]
MKEIKATAPTPQDCIELVRENEKLNRQLRTALSLIEYYESEKDSKNEIQS